MLDSMYHCSSKQCKLKQIAPSGVLLNQAKARFFLLVDLQDFFFRSRVGETEKKPSENDQLTGHFQLFFFC